MIKYSVPILAYLSILSRYADSTPEIPDCDWAGYRHVGRMRDLSDCTKFYYCVQGQPPYHGSCPTALHNGNKDYTGYYFLYYNPNTTHCDWRAKAPEDCFLPPTKPAPTTTTTPPPTTTTKKPRPPMLADDYDFNIDCRRTSQSCGFFPNTYGSCDSYVLCVDGEKHMKKCHAGQLFDIKTKECRHASNATCWKEPNAGPHHRHKGFRECPFHGNPPARPVETRKDGTVLQNPMVTNWGNWQKWEECPKGTYATGMYAWRRVITQGWTRTDHCGMVSLSFLCQKPGGNETNNFIESLAPGLPHDGWPFYYMCKGAVVGIRLNSVAQNGWGWDQLATDNVQALCSCSGPVYKPYEEYKYYPQNGNRGTWTAPQYCKRGQAVCGMQTQMHDYKESLALLGVYDNNGLNNMKVKCCDIADPLKNCVPTESRLLIRECDNAQSDDGLRCDFEGEIGLTMDFDQLDAKSVEFYSSIGYTFESSKKNVSEYIVSKLEEKMKAGSRMEYTWDDIVEPTVMKNVKVVPNKLFVKPFENMKLYQIVGRCGHFLVRTNRFVKVTKGKSGNKQQVFEL